MAVTDYHTHTARCGHAGGAARDYVLHAASRGLTEIAITDHLPLYFLDGDDPEPGLAMARSELPAYVDEVLKSGAERAARIANRTVSKVYRKVGLLQLDK